MENPLGAFFAGAFAFTLFACGESKVTSLGVAPTVHFASTTYAGAQTALNSAGSASLVFTFENAAQTQFAVGSGSSAAPPVGLNASTTGTVQCAHLDITQASVTGLTVVVSSCSGNGSVQVSIAEAALASSTALTSSALDPVTLTVDNTVATGLLVLNSGTTANSDGANTVVATFSESVHDLSATNADAAFTISGCSGTDPSILVTMSTDGSGHSVATGVLSGGNCSVADVITVDLDMTKVSDLAGNAGVSSPAAVTYTVSAGAVVTLGSFNYPSTRSALGSSTAGSFSLTMSNTAVSTLGSPTPSGSTASAPSGLTIIEHSASCSTVTVASPATTTSSVINVSGCSGNGTIDFQASANVAHSTGNLGNAVSSTLTIQVQTTALAVSSTVIQSDPGGTNLIADVTFNEDVDDLSGTTQYTASCGATPFTATLSMTTSQIAHFALPSTCTTGQVVSLSILLNHIVIKATGDFGPNGAPSPTTYTIP